MKSKIIQIATSMTSMVIPRVDRVMGSTVEAQIIARCYGLDENGTVWMIDDNNQWKKIVDSPEIPNSLKKAN